MKVSNLVKKLPHTPGCYLFKDAGGNVIYVGKAKDLKNRVGSYFSQKFNINTKTYSLVEKIRKIDHVLVNTEMEALILEAELIKKYRPKYNIILKDDKSYLYIVIRPEKVKINNRTIVIDKVITERRSGILYKDVVFGPYPNSNSAKQILKNIRKIISFRDCLSQKFNRQNKLNKMCLFGYIGVCMGPCIKNDKRDLAKYKQNIKKIKKILKGESKKIENELLTRMNKASRNQEYEEASVHRDLLNKFKYVTQSFIPVEKYMENPYLLEDAAKVAIESLQKNLPMLTKAPKRIECYDISNISGKEAVGSMVVSVDGIIKSSEYKKFKIKTKDTPDDFYMLKEVLKRRLKHEIPGYGSQSWGMPDLLLIDGGRGQVSSIKEVCESLGLKLNVIGLAKKNETIVYVQDNEFIELMLNQSNQGLRLLIRLRDEAHRFAQKYHHLLRLKKISE